MNIYLGPQLPKDREAVGLFPRVSFRSCLQVKVEQEIEKYESLELTR